MGLTLIQNKACCLPLLLTYFVRIISAVDPMTLITLIYHQINLLTNFSIRDDIIVQKKWTPCTHCFRVLKARKYKNRLVSHKRITMLSYYSQSPFEIHLQLPSASISKRNLLSLQKLPRQFAKALTETNDLLDVKIKTRLDVYSVRLYCSPNGSLYLSNGWKQIVKQHRLKVGDRLSLTCKQDMSLLLTIFDKSGAEKQYKTLFLTQGSNPIIKFFIDR